MTYILMCNGCGDIVEFEAHLETCMYGVAYLAGAQHEKEHKGPRCSTGAARFLRLIGIRLPSGSELLWAS
jgi:hypothetical protein